MNLNTHPHPYGIVIAGNDMGTAQQSYLYCAAYGNGTFIVRGFGPEPFQMKKNGLTDHGSDDNRRRGPQAEPPHESRRLASVEYLYMHGLIPVIRRACRGPSEYILAQECRA